MHPYKVAAVALAAIVALAGYAAWAGAREDRFFTQALAQAGIPTYAMELGAKKLAYAQALAQRNPLLALPGTDLAQLDQDIAELRELKAQLYELNASSTNAALLHTLYQTDFLIALSGLEHARRAFIASGSSKDQEAYNSAAQKAFAAYHSDAAAFKKAFAAAVPKESGKFATDGDIISRADILLALDRLMEDSSYVAAAFAARVQCTRGAIRSCRANDLEPPSISVTQEATTTAQELAQAKAVRALSAQAHAQPAIAKGPMLLLPSTQCAKNMGGGAPLFAMYAPASLGDKRGPFPIYVGNLRFDDTHSSSSTAFARFTAAMQQKITYILDSPMLHYSCIKSAHDAGRLFAMQDAYDFAQAQNLSRYATSSQALARLEALEKKDLAVLTERQVEEYLVEARALPLPAEQESRVREMTLAYIFTSAHFDRNIGEILADEKSNIALVKKGWPIALDVPYMFFIRSSFWALLLADNQSAIPSDAIRKVFPPNTIPMDKQPYIYYSQLPHMAATTQKLIHDIDFFYSVHIDPDLVSGLVER